MKFIDDTDDDDEFNFSQVETVEDLLVEGVYTMIDLASQNGLDDETINRLIQKVLNDRSKPRFKVLE